jgi:hypothetical protein
MSELPEELRGLQAVCERLGVDDDGALDRAADYIEELAAAAQGLLDATGHSTWKRLFKAPSVEQAIYTMKTVLEKAD